MDLSTKTNLQRLPTLATEFRREFDGVIRVPTSHQFFPKDWKSKDRQNKFENFLQVLKLKKMKDLNSMNFNDLSEGLLGFCKDNFKRNYLMVHQKLVNYLSNFDLELQIVNWLEILSVVFLDKLIQSYEDLSDKLPKEIIYSKKLYISYVKSPWWLEVTKSIASISEEPQQKKVRLETDFTREDVARIMKRSAKCLEKVDDKIGKFTNMSNFTLEAAKKFDEQLFKCEQNVSQMIMKWEGKL